MLGHALAIMRPIAQQLSAPDLIERLDDLRTTYRFLTDYFMSGADDPRRTELLDGLVHDAYVLLDDIRLRKNCRESTAYEYREMLRPTDESSDAASAFRYFWLGTVDDAHLARFDQLIADPEMEDEAMMAVSALTLSVLRSFSEKGVLALIRAAGDNCTQYVRERAWVGLLLILLVYDERLHFFPEIVSSFMDLLVDEDGRVFAVTAMTCIVRTLGVDWVNGTYESLQQKLLPLINKHMPKSFESDTVSKDELDDFSARMDDEFADLLDEQRKEMARLNELHLDTQFAMFKDMYATPFFSEPYRWWLPYTDYYLPDDVKQHTTLFSLIPMQDMCDSDKYAFLTTMARVGVINGKPIAELNLPEIPAQNENAEHFLCNDYVRQMYRFFRLNPWQIDDPFLALRQLHKSQVFHLLYASAAEKKVLADTIMDCRSYQLAGNIYALIADLLQMPEVYSHWGFCYQKNGEFELALSCYAKAEALKPSEWLLRQMEYCNKQLKAWDEVIRLCDRLLAINSSSAASEAYLFEKAKCCEMMELYAEALQLFYRLDLQHPDSPAVLRSIGWCSILCDDYETAAKYYARLAALGKEKLIDWLNQGHLHFIRGDRMEAFRCYHRCLLQSPGLKDFLQMFRPDRYILMEKGLTREEIYLMEDQLISAHFGA